MKRRVVRNIKDFQRVAEVSNIQFGGEGSRQVELELNPVGPVTVYMVQPGEKKGEAQEWLVAVVDSHEMLCFEGHGVFAVRLEPSHEVWVRRSEHTVVTGEDSGDTLTRMEKQGLYLDDLSIALHRQAILTRIQQEEDGRQRKSHADSLERKLDATSKLVEELQRQLAEKNPPGEQESAAEDVE